MTDISRRDFLNGTLVASSAAGAASSPLGSWAAPADQYPPSLTGMRGAHPGAFEKAHEIAFQGEAPNGPLAERPENYDLIVIGAGISGLSAAYFYLKSRPHSRILVLDNHDDFGGHAKRNEFVVDGTKLLAYGGTQSIDTPSQYSSVAKGLLRELGIELDQLEDSYDMEFFSRYNLSMGTFYDASTFGKNVLLNSSLPTTKDASTFSQNVVPGLLSGRSFETSVSEAPLTSKQRKQIETVIKGSKKAVSWFEGPQGRVRFFSKSYVHFLDAVYGISDPAIVALLSMPLAEETALGGSGISIPAAIAGGLLGLPPASVFEKFGSSEEVAGRGKRDDEPYVHHFPDGNATIARLLVRKLIPTISPQATDPIKCVTAKYDYAQLDRAGNSVRIRLNSLAVNVANSSGKTRVRYVRDGKLFEANAPHTVMAGWHMLAAHIIPSLPPKQKAAMRANIKMPLVYAQIALRQWRPIHKSSVGTAYCPGSYFQFVQLDYPVNIGAYDPKRTPDDPTVLLMIRMPCPLMSDGSIPDLLRAGRSDLLGTTFETFEQNIRDQLQSMYGQYGFNSNRDIAAITINRWPHGYVWEDAEYDGQPAHRLSSKRHGNIVMANSDAAGRAYTDAAIDMAWKAIREVTEK